MKNNTLLFGVLLLVNGVFDVDADEVSVTVMVGDSVTLHVTEIPRGSNIIWKFGDEIIARMNEADGNPSTYDGPGAIFKDRLKLDKQTGSLTITNIRTEHNGRYSVDIRSTNAELKTFQVTVHDVVESVSVTEGDSVTLHTGVKVQGSDQIVWKFEDQVIPITNLNSLNDAKWRNIHLKDQTPDLVISNIQSDQTGVYKVEINTISKVVHRKYCIAVGDEMKIVSVKEGESVTLRTGAVDIQAFDLILWEYEDHPMAKIDRTLHQLPKNSVSSRFAGRLSQNENNGYLTISDSRSTDSGDYHLNMNNSAFTLQRTIRVTVKASPQSGAPSGICGAGVGLVVWVVTAFFAARFVDNQGKGVSVNIK
uniref:Immunoglobulin domain-containing protein n=1 Tax=Cyprinus carpio TaxID=7962 RepID=A0A8C2EG85_CYPCA